MEVEQGIIDAGERVTNGLRKYLRVFSALTVVAPLLGLLGTVIGMIETFNVVAETSVSWGSPAVGGGYQPGPVEHRVRTHRRHSRAVLLLLFVGCVDRLIIDMDSLGQELVNLISPRKWQNRNEIATTRPRRPVRATEADA